MRDNFVFLVIFDTCDVMYNWFISLLPPIVLVNLFGTNHVNVRKLYAVEYINTVCSLDYPFQFEYFKAVK